MDRPNVLKIEEGRLRFTNFAGDQTPYNRIGDRNFCVILEDEGDVERLIRDGWNVKTLTPREEGDPEQKYLKVTVKYNEHSSPKIVMISDYGNGKISKTPLDESSVSILDRCRIKHADLIINPYHWDVNGKQGISAYLNSGYIVVEMDEFASKYE